MMLATTQDFSYDFPASIASAADIGVQIRSQGEGATDCLRYEDSIFYLTCNFTWKDHYFEGEYILLQGNETFNGNDYEIDLYDLNYFWEGLFQIDTDVQRDDAPLIKHLHVTGGETSYHGGFIVQADQHNFTVDSCSSNGTIRGTCTGGCKAGGGICGHQCSGTILLMNCWSTGPIEGESAGGIAGRSVGVHGGQVNITNCWSKGEISGMFSGGICGSRTGDDEGFVAINKSYSKGEIQGQDSGGICGGSSGFNNGHVKISQCYTLGEIRGDGSGGATGRGSAALNGLVEITDSYTRGDIVGGTVNLQGAAGGICGRDTGEENGVVFIENVYASGSIETNHGGGIIGHLHTNANEVSITMSVYNDGPIVGPDSAHAPEETGNSGNLDDIRGKVYCYDDQDECWDAITVWKAMPPNKLPRLRAEILPLPSSTPVKTPTQTNSPTMTKTSTPTETWTRTTTSIPSFTGTPTSTGTLLLSPTPSSSSTTSPASTATSTRTETISSSHSQRLAQSPTSFGTGTFTSKLSPTPTSFQSMTLIPSSTSFGTTSETRTTARSIIFTPSYILSPIPSYTADKTKTATASPSFASLTNESRLITSACGVLQAFDCVTVNYEATVNLVVNINSIGKPVNTKLSNTSTVTIQSVEGTAPNLKFFCGIDVDGKTLNPGDCSDQSSARQSRIPFHFEYEMMSNSSCTGRIRTNRCRLFVFVVNICKTVNGSDGQKRILIEEERSTMYAMTMSVISVKETLLSIRQLIRIGDRTTDTVKTLIDVSSHPSTYSKTISRDHSTPASYNISIQLAGRSDVHVSWILPPLLSKFIETPKTNAIASGEFPPRLAIRDQSLRIQTHLLPHGISAGTIKIMFSVAEGLISTNDFDVNITVLEGHIRLRQSSVEIAQSSTEDPTSRAILLANEGDKEVIWRSKTILVQGTDWEASGVPWLSFPREGKLLANDEQPFFVEVSPQLAAGLGVFEAWILIETNSWTGDSQNLEEEFRELFIPRVDTVDVSFWIHVRFIVSSIFLCQQFAPVTTIMPNEIRVLPLRVINTEPTPITVILRNFSITTANVSVVTPTKGAVIAENSIDVDETVVNRASRLTPWWTIAPSRLTLQPGTSRGFHMKIRYSDTELVPQELEFKFLLECFFGTVANPPAGVVPTDFVVAFGPGIASPKTSYVVGNKTHGGIGDRLQFVVKLLDIFHHGPATALFDMQGLGSSRHKQLPRLTITARTLSSVGTNDVLRLDFVSGPGIVTEFQFTLDLQTNGEVEVDVKLGNVSVPDFPIKIVSNAIECQPNFEVPNLAGTICLCQSGHYRSEIGRCNPCPPGTFMPSASNEKGCFSCPPDYFAENGESTCHKCVGRGIQCVGGILRMKEGYWCEACQDLQLPRVPIIHQIQREKDDLFHECIPPESCVVNTTSFASTCASGYAKGSPVCDPCDTGFVKTEFGKCTPCKSGVQDFILTIMGILLVFLAIAIITVLSYRDVMSDGLGVFMNSASGQTYRSCKAASNNKHSAHAHRRSTLCIQDGMLKATAQNKPHMSALNGPKPPSNNEDRALTNNLVSARHTVLLLVDYFQIAFILHSMEISPFVLNNEWINTVGIMMTFTPSQTDAVQCTMDNSPFETTLITMLSPLVLFVCLMVIQALTILYQTKCKCPFPWTTLMSSFARSAVLVMNLIHMCVTNATLQVFDVYPVDIGSKERSSLDLTMETSGSRYKLLHSIAIASLVLFVLGYPLLIVGYYLKLHSMANTPEALKQFSKMTGGFNINGLGFLWETVVLTRKVALLLVVSFVTGPVAQLIWASATLIISVFLLAALMPYRKRFINYLQYIMILTGLVTLAIGFLMRVALDETGEQTKVDTLSNIVLILQLTLILAALIVQASLAPKALRSMRTILLNKLPRCRRPRPRAASQGKKQESNEWTFTHSPLHHESENVLKNPEYQHSQLSLHRGDSIALANMVLQKESRRMFKGVTKVKRPRKLRKDK